MGSAHPTRNAFYFIAGVIVKPRILGGRCGNATVLPKILGFIVSLILSSIFNTRSDRLQFLPIQHGNLATSSVIYNRLELLK